MAINELRSISIFVKAAELGSLRKAAAALGISPQAASQALAQLEQHLDVRLFHRTTRVMSLTDEGRQFLEGSAAGAARAAARGSGCETRQGGNCRAATNRRATIDLPARPLAAAGGILSTVPRHRARRAVGRRVGNWVEDRVDVGFRLGLAAHEGVIARRLFAVQLIICASPKYLERCGKPESLAALQSHRCSVFRHPSTGAIVPWRVKIGPDIVEQPVTPAISTNDEILELQAVLAGQAIGQLAGVTAAPYIRSGRLVPLLVEHMSDRASYFVYFGSRSSQPARARAFVDLAVRTLADNSEYVLAPKELRAAQAKRKSPRP
jgi:DNA-binding transcriptional LysR family regulator